MVTGRQNSQMSLFDFVRLDQVNTKKLLASLNLIEVCKRDSKMLNNGPSRFSPQHLCMAYLTIPCYLIFIKPPQISDSYRVYEFRSVCTAN